MGDFRAWSAREQFGKETAIAVTQSMDSPLERATNRNFTGVGALAGLTAQELQFVASRLK
jgi:hypothetical protein